MHTAGRHSPGVTALGTTCVPTLYYIVPELTLCGDLVFPQVAVVGHTLRLVVCRDEKGAHRSSATFAGVPRVQENIASVRDACQARLKVVKRLVDDPDQTLPQVSCFLRHVPVCVFLLWSQTRRVVQETVDTLRPTRKAAAKKRPAARCSGGSNTNKQDNNNKVARASAAARGVSFIFGRFFWSKSGKPGILRGFRQQHDVSVFSFSNVRCSCFLVAFLRKCRKYHAFRAFFKFNFSVIFEVFVWKVAKM